MANLSLFKFESYKINDYVTLKLERGKTFIYVYGRRFIQCIQLALQIHKEDVTVFDEIESIDQAEELYSSYIWQNKTLERNGILKNVGYHAISSKEEFWGHCSVRHEVVWLNAEA